MFFVTTYEAFQLNEALLAKPKPEKCQNRPKHFTQNGRNYFFSRRHAETEHRDVSWLEARNICREYCMETVSIGTEKMFDVVVKFLEDNLIDYIWTSGHVCDPSFPGCENDLKFTPRNINGWFWAGSNNAKIPPTNANPPNWKQNPWSPTGHKNLPQPDNAEYEINRKSESCLAVLHNVYGDGIKFHDVACYHKKPFICEDSDELLKIVAN